MTEGEKILLDIQFDERLVANAIKAVQEYRDQIDILKASQEQLKTTGQEGSTTFIRQEAQIKALSAAMRQNERIVQANSVVQQKQNGHINNLKANIIRLTAEYDKLSKEELENANVGGKLQKQIKSQSDELKKLKSAIGDNRLEVGSYKQQIVGAVKEINVGGVSVGNLTDKFAAMINPVTASIALLGGLVAGYASSAVGARDLRLATDQLASAFRFAINNYGEFIDEMAKDKDKGLFENLSFQISRALFGEGAANKGRAVALANEQLQLLEISNAFAKGFAKDREREAEDLRRIRDDETKTTLERLHATDEITEKLTSSEQLRTTVLQAQVEAIKDASTNYDLDYAAQLRVAEAQSEIKDIQEEINGKLTENLTSRRAIIAALDEQRKRELSLAGIDLLSAPDVKGAGVTGRRKRNSETLIKDGTLAILDSEKLAARALGEITKSITENNAKTARSNAEAARSYQEKAEAAVIAAQHEQAAVGATIGVLDTLSGVLKENSAGQKAFGLASIAIDTGAAIAAGIRSAISTPFPGNIAAMFLTIQTILQNVQKAKDIAGFYMGGLIEGFAGGGRLTGTRIMPWHGRAIRRSNGDDRLITAKVGEVMLNERQQHLLGGANTFRKIGVPGFADGGFVARSMSNQVTQSFDINRMTTSFENAMKRVRIYTRITDIQKLQSRSASTQVTADLR